MTRRYSLTRSQARLAAILATVLLTGAVFVLPAKSAPEARAVAQTYADIALAG